MKFPLFSSMTKSLALGSMMLLTLFTLTVADVNAQRLSATSTTKEQSVVMATTDTDACQNGARGTAELQCTGGAWSNGNLNINNSQWVEGEYVPVRIKISALDPGAQNQTVTIDYDTTTAGKHTFDFLGTYDASTTPPGGNTPCSGVSPCGTPTTFAIPDDPLVPNAFEPAGRLMTIWNGTIDSISTPTVISGDYTGTSITRIVITYDVNPGLTNVVIAFGAHIATRLDWGVGTTAIDLNGSPYHLTAGGGQVSMKVDATIFPATIVIIKEVTTLGAPPGSTATFGFNFQFSQIHPSTPTTNSTFMLIDDVVGTGGGGSTISTLSANATEMFQTTEFGAASTITVTEANYTPVWTLLGAPECVENPGGVGYPQLDNSTGNQLARTATIIAEEAEIIFCTFRNSQLIPTAAPASISGRTTDSFGNGIGNTRVTVMDAQSGETFIAITNPFGYYTIEGPQVGNFYVITVANKRYTFADDTRTFTLNDDITGMDFIANP